MLESGAFCGKRAIEWRFADGQSERLPALAEELVRLNVDVLVSGSSQAIKALQKATATISIVMATAGDPVGSGFVTNLAIWRWNNPRRSSCSCMARPRKRWVSPSRNRYGCARTR